MKKMIVAFFCLLSLNGFGQKSKWFVSFSAGKTWGGPSTSLKNKMNQQGFNETSNFNFFGYTGTVNYPIKTEMVSLLLSAGKKINEKRSIYFIAGRTAKGRVSGFKNQAYTNLFDFFGASMGESPTVEFSLYQLSAGFMYRPGGTRVRLGIAPTVFLLKYFMNWSQKETTIVPGASLTGRLPLGKEKRSAGFELVLETNLAPPAKMKNTNSTNSFRPGRVNMISGFAGVAFCLRG